MTADNPPDDQASWGDTICDQCSKIIPFEEGNSCDCGMTLCNDHASEDCHDHEDDR